MTLMLLCGVSSVWAAEGDTHDFSQTLSQLLNNNASISSITISNPGYPVKAVKVTWSYNKSINSAVAITVNVGGSSFGTVTVGSNKSSQIASFESESTTGDIVVSFENKAGSGTGKGTFEVSKVQLIEGGSVASKTLSKITVSNPITSFFVNEKFEFGGTVTASYEESEVPDADVTDKAEFTGYDMTREGEQNVTVSYTEKGISKSDEYKINVRKYNAEAGTYTIGLNNVFYGVNMGNNGTEQSAVKYGITVISGCNSSASTKTYYDAEHIRYYTDSYLKLQAPDGFIITNIEFIEPTSSTSWNGKITANCGTYDNTSKSWTGSDSEVNFSFAAQNRIASIEVTYEAPKALTGIAVKSAPTKTEYFVDDEFDPAGLEITATYEGGSTKDIEYNATDFAFTGYDSKTAGTQTITVTYKEKTATFEVTVKARTLTAIAINGDLSKTTYVEGDDFEFDGLTAQGSYNDGSYKNLTDEVEWSVSPSTLTASVTSVTVTATLGEISGTKDIAITVNEKSIANTYTSNVLLSTDGGTSASKATVKWNDSEYEAIKAGTGSVAGSCVVYIPEGTTTLHFHAAAWNKETVTLKVNGTNFYELKADAGVSANSPFTLKNDPESNDYFTFETDGSTTAITFEATGDGCRFVLFGVNVDDEASQNVTITDAGWATACLPMNATVSGATAYYAKVDNGEIVKTEADVIPAGTGVLLKGKGTATFTVSNKTVDNTSDNMLKGSLVKKTFEESGKLFYILTNGEKGIGFYWDRTTNDEGESAICAAGKAVLEVESKSANANNFFTFEDVTAIEAVKDVTANAKRYNLNGQAVGADYKGIVIMNGKKMFNK